MATAKQIAWRKKFAALSKAGKLKRKTATKREKNPVAKKRIARVGVSKKKYVARPSQATRTAPSKRLTARRKKVVSPSAPSGYFPNPRTGLKHSVCKVRADGGAGAVIAKFDKKTDAVQYAKAYAKLHRCQLGVI